MEWPFYLEPLQLNCYYVIQLQDEFNSLFGELYTGKNTAATRDSYYILEFVFSVIDASTSEKTFNGFLEKLKGGTLEFNEIYALRLKSELTNILQNEVKG